MTTGREDHTAVLLLDGRVLVAGGTVSEDSPRFTSAEIFDPETGNWSPTGSMNVGRSEIEYAAVRLPDGRVVILPLTPRQTPPTCSTRRRGPGHQPA
jgi:Kelch motif